MYVLSPKKADAPKKRARSKTAEPVRSPNIALRSKDPAIRKRAGDESREAQVNGAVYPSEVALFNEACTRAGITRSDVIREHLVRLAEQQCVIRKRPETRRAQPRAKPPVEARTET